jgi:hypothetical protein
MKWESDMCEVNGSKGSKKVDTREVVFMWWEIEPLWEYHNGGGYILNP